MEVHTSDIKAAKRLLKPRSRAPQAIDRLLYQLLLEMGVAYYGLVEGQQVAISDAATCWFTERAESKGFLAGQVMQSAAASFGGLEADFVIRMQVLMKSASQLLLAQADRTDIDSGISIEPENVLKHRFFWLAIKQNWDLAWMGLGTYNDCTASGMLKFIFRRDTPWISRRLDHITTELINKLPNRNGYQVLIVEKEIKKWLSGK
ncbi:hypothetical protein [Spongorhabdus nitratireducens]